MDAARSPQLHVAIFPWLAFGHLLPHLQLSKSLARRGHRISFLSTPRNLQRLPKLPPSLSHLITLVELPFPSAGISLPPGAEATLDIQPADNYHLKAAFDALEDPFTAFLDSVDPPVDWIFHDFTAHWMPRVAVPRGVPCGFFSVFPTWSMAFHGSPGELIGNIPRVGRLWKRPEDLTLPPPWTASVLSVAYSPHDARNCFEIYKAHGSSVSDMQRLGFTIDSAQFVMFRSCPEVDGDLFLLLRRLYGKPVIPTGFLHPPPEEELNHKPPTVVSSSVADIFVWLNGQAPISVLYVAFGSEAVISVDLYHELALGLELSQLPFLWALRRPNDLPPDVDLLPAGFEARTAGLGIVATDWLPQQEILAHPAVGGFLTHCGWSSVVEGLSLGQPLVTLPMFGDQFLTAQVMSSRNWGVEVPRDEQDGSFTREGVAKATRFVMLDEAGAEVRAAVLHAAEVFGDRALQERCEDELAQYLVDHRGCRRRRIAG